MLVGVNDNLSNIFKNRKMRTRENYKIEIVKDDITKKLYFTVHYLENFSLLKCTVLQFSKDS
jgi:hypothetical protein